MAKVRNLSEYSSNWGCIEDEKIPLLLFVQRSRELLLHTSSMLARPALNSPFVIAREIQFLLVQHKRTPHSSTQANLEILLREFKSAIKFDDVAKRLVGDRLELLERMIINFGSINSQIEAAVFLNKRLTQTKYFEDLAEEVIRIVESGGREKEKLVRLTEGFIAAARDAGYPAQTIYHLLNVAFLDKTKQKLSSRERLTKFFSNFDLASHSYTVHFNVAEVAKGVAQTFPSVNANFLECSSAEAIAFREKLPASTRNFFAWKEGNAIVSFDNVTALDPQSARKIAERSLRLLDDVLRFSVHRRRFVIENPAIVVPNEKPDQYVHSNRARSPILRVPHDPADENPDLSNFSLIFRSAQTNSVSRFVRAIELHSTAIASPEEEAQLLNIWIAFETLFVRGSEGSKIKEIVECVSPYITGCWGGYHFAEMWSTIVASHAASWNAFLEKAPDVAKYQDHYSLIAAVSLIEYKERFTEFLAQLDSDPLLRFKLCSTIKWAQSAKKIIEHEELVEQRVADDLARIYRTRNQIVHTGKSVGDLGEVVQCAHHYLDLVLNLLSLMLGRPGGPVSIEQANIEARIKKRTHLDVLYEAASKGENCTPGNFLALHVGRTFLE